MKLSCVSTEPHLQELLRAAIDSCVRTEPLLLRARSDARLQICFTCNLSCVWVSNIWTIASCVPGTVSGPGAARTASKIGQTRSQPCSWSKEMRSLVASSSASNNKNATVEVSGRGRFAATMLCKMSGCCRDRHSRTTFASTANPAKVSLVFTNDVRIRSNSNHSVVEPGTV